MPRLLLVDDNPSIHKIAESLLTSTDIALVCVDGGSRALALLDAGETFDAALVDISMAGMDGWDLLKALRQRPESATLPVALMAGVLDTVDPQRLQAAPIQDFLKKPVELRDLADRVRHLVAMVVEPQPAAAPEPEPVAVADTPAEDAQSPFATVPSMKIRPSTPPEPLPSEAPLEEDLLILGEADLFPEEAPASTEPVLDLEAEPELALDDLDLLLATEAGTDEVPALDPEAQEPEPEVAEAEAPALPSPSPDTQAQEVLPDMDLDLLPELESALDLEDVEDLNLSEPLPPSLSFTDEAPHPTQELAEPPVSESAVTAEGLPELPDLGPSLDAPFEVDLLSPEPPAPQPSLDWTEDSADLLKDLQAGPAATPAIERVHAEPAPLEEATTAIPMLAAAAAVAAVVPPPASDPQPAAISLEPETTVPIPVVTSQEPSGAAPDAAALVAAILADPQALDLLARALGARLAEQTLREIAWEVMPDALNRLKPY